jgi:hypothetical protein
MRVSVALNSGILHIGNVGPLELKVQHQEQIVTTGMGTKQTSANLPVTIVDSSQYKARVQ